MQQEINTLLLKGINLFGDLHHTGTLLEIQALPDLNIIKLCSGELSWILNTYFKNKLPPCEIKPRLNIGDAPESHLHQFFYMFSQKTNKQQTSNRQLRDVLVTNGERRQKGNTMVPSCSVPSRSHEASLPGVPRFLLKTCVL